MGAGAVQASRLDATCVDDPHGATAILAVSGVVHDEALAALARESARFEPPMRVFFDFTAARIPDCTSMRRLEDFIDGLEASGFGIQVTGVSPEHPALRA